MSHSTSWQLSYMALIDMMWQWHNSVSLEMHPEADPGFSFGGGGGGGGGARDYVSARTSWAQSPKGILRLGSGPFWALEVLGFLDALSCWALSSSILIWNGIRKKTKLIKIWGGACCNPPPPPPSICHWHLRNYHWSKCQVTNITHFIGTMSCWYSSKFQHTLKKNGQVS